jgi:hypothetical protein
MVRTCMDVRQELNPGDSSKFGPNSHGLSRCDPKCWREAGFEDVRTDPRVRRWLPAGIGSWTCEMIRLRSEVMYDVFSISFVLCSCIKYIDRLRVFASRSCSPPEPR